jgi:ATP-dependent DNA helicase RecG
MLRAVPVTHVAGVGLAKQKCLAALGIFTVDDLLHYFPYRFEDRRIQPFESLQDGAKVTVRGVIEGNSTVRWQGRKSLLTATFRVDHRYPVTLMWFNQHYLKSKLVDGRILTVSGKFNRSRGTIVVSQTDFGGQGSFSETGFVPVYSVTKGITSAQLHRIIIKALEQYAHELVELLPHELVSKYRLISHQEAVKAMHQPQNAESLRQARRRLAFEEFFLFQMQLQWFRAQRSRKVKGVSHRIPDDAFDTFKNALPFPLTDSQVEACLAIQEDMSSPTPMNRLLQGDVGSGKTWVAFWGAYAAFRAEMQSALMAPTEILAEQHYEEARLRLAPLGMQVALLTGSTPERERRTCLEKLKRGEVHFIIGTHALLTDDVDFHRLGLVITDEQHRFGVVQRALLRAKGGQPDVLFLSATPIPRTLALAIYGDLDVSVLKHMPAGRKPIQTVWIEMKNEAEGVRKVRQELAKGRQAYVVAPLVEESEDLSDVLSATQLYERMKELFAGFQVGLLHGRMSSRDKDDVMRSFVKNEVQILVATTVIEVGINVPNATVMMVYHAERFGLSQLHQLRGRVGRGSEQSYCLLLADAKNEIARERLRTMVETTDGFVIAERDLALRGPGEFLGVRQSGLPEFSVGDLTRDLRVMEVARDEAIRLVSHSDFWLLPAYAGLREWISERPLEGYYKD